MRRWSKGGQFRSFNIAVGHLAVLFWTASTLFLSLSIYLSLHTAICPHGHFRHFRYLVVVGVPNS